MKTIWKWTLVSGKNEIDMPMNAQVLTTQTQLKEPQLWALVNPDYKREKRTFLIYGTGHDIPDDFNGKYIGTFQIDGGIFIYHVFEATK